MQQHFRTPGQSIGAIFLASVLISGMLLMAPVFARADTSVSVIDNSFSPQTITIAPGDTVTWTNNGSMNHTVTADDGSFSSGTLLPKSSFTHTFSTAGSFPYYCQFHGAAGGVGMAGTVVVSSSASSTSASSTLLSSTNTSSSTTASSTNKTSATSTASTTGTTTSATSSNETATTTSATSTGVVLSNRSVTPSDTSAMISWNTNINADAQVSYGLTTVYTTTTASDNASSTNHVVFIGGLVPGTLYHFRTMSTANGISGMSPDDTFTTTKNVGTSTGTSTPSSSTNSSTTSTTTPSTDISSLNMRVAQLEAAVKSLQARILEILRNGGIFTPGNPMTSTEGTAVYADEYAIPPSGAIHFRGEGFGANETVNIVVDGRLIGVAQTDSEGGFTISGTASNQIGDTTLWFTGVNSGKSDSVMITVVSGDEEE